MILKVWRWCSSSECDPVILRVFGLIDLYCNGCAAVRLRYRFGLCSDIFITTDVMLAVLRFWHWLKDLPEYRKTCAILVPERTFNPATDSYKDSALRHVCTFMACRQLPLNKSGRPKASVSCHAAATAPTHFLFGSLVSGVYLIAFL